MPLVLMFPGQSSRYPGLFDKLTKLSRKNHHIVEHASDTLGRDLLHHYRADNADAFVCNTDVQVGVFLANHMFLQLLSEEGIEADLSLGLSLGEWNHIVHIGALSFEHALGAVAERGAAYDAGPRGAMASIYPLDVEDLQAVVDQVKGSLEIVNLNSPRQNVLSGERAALDEALAILEAEHFCDATIIEKQVPMHSSMFAPVAERFAQYLSTLSFATPRLPYFPNQLGALIDAPSQAEYVELLSRHVCAPVLWRQSIDRIMSRWPDAVLLEVGPKKVLFNLLDKKWHRGVCKMHMDTPDDTRAHLAELAARLSVKAA
jgi:[acyl-carrier-protein] S-malonyltransferase